MGQGLIECQRYLERRYRTLLNMQTGFSDSIQDNKPAWLSVPLENLGRAGKNPNDGAAVLIDPEIGTLLYIIEYKENQDVVALIVKALELRTQLLLGGDGVSTEAAKDRLGAWRIVLYWLVDQSELNQAWESAVARLRAEAPHMEEIPIDSICKGDDAWSAAFQSHGFPRLLLNFRQVMRIHSRLEVDRWSTADTQVEEELEGFSKKFSDKTQRELALTVERQLSILKSGKAAQGKDVSGPKEGYKLPRTIGVKSFRNVQEVILDLACDPVSCLVIAGPNGSGKSTLFEAISLATFGSSYRYLEYLNDSDAGLQRTPENYINKYLTNLSFNQWGAPKFFTSDQWKDLRLPAAEEAANIERESEGCFLSQEQSAEFCKRTSSELAAEVLKGYSDLANGIQWYVDEEYQKANSERQNLMRSLGQRASITKVSTAHQKVSENQLTNATQFSTSSMVAWLAIAATDFGDFMPNAEKVRRLWQRWDERRGDVAEQCVVLLEADVIGDVVTKWLDEYNSAIAESNRLFGGHVFTFLEHMRSSDESVKDQIKEWGLWLEKKTSALADDNEQAVVSLKKELDALTKQQAEVAKDGSLFRARLDHLNVVRNGIEGIWIEEHEKICPTCDSDLSQQGGLKQVLDELFEETSRQRGFLENRFREISGKIREVNEGLRNFGVIQNPVSEDNQQILVRLISPFLNAGMTLDSMLTEMSSRSRLLSFIEHLQSRPSIPPVLEVQQVASNVTKSIIDQCITVSQTFNAPNNWAAVRKQLVETLGNVVESHLPNTLGALWSEIALNLTAAPWLLRLKPTFHARTQRNAYNLSIRIGSDANAPLARHILNQAEVNILGLAWFFVKFVTSGRFVLPMLVLDDPAQEMDQTTYRDLCRMLETIVRMHRNLDTQLALVVLFHQEDRALDASRALNATLSVLSWTETQTAQSIRKIKVFGKAQPLKPAAVLVG